MKAITVNSLTPEPVKFNTGISMLSFIVNLKFIINESIEILILNFTGSGIN